MCIIGEERENISNVRLYPLIVIVLANPLLRISSGNDGGYYGDEDDNFVVITSVN